MSCDMSGGCSKADVWKVTNNNSTLPHYKEFHVCNFHLHCASKLKDMQKALYKGRFFVKQLGMKVEWDGWCLEKVANTWKKSGIEVSCDKCDETKRLWIIQKQDKKAKTHCNGHLNRYPKEVKFSNHKDPFGICTYEESWDNNE